MSARATRAWFTATAVCVLAGVTISVVTSANNANGYFHPALARAANALAFFTVQSNLLVGLACVLLALRPGRSSAGFAVLRLTGLVAISGAGPGLRHARRPAAARRLRLGWKAARSRQTD